MSFWDFRDGQLLKQCGGDLASITQDNCRLLSGLNSVYQEVCATGCRETGLLGTLPKVSDGPDWWWFGRDFGWFLADNPKFVEGFNLVLGPGVQNRWSDKSIQFLCFTHESPSSEAFAIYQHTDMVKTLGAVSIRKTVLPGMAIPMLKIRRPNGRLIFNMEIAIRR